MNSDIQNIINESLADEVRKTILKEEKEGHEVFHITCEGEPVETFKTESEANAHLDIYKKKHPEKQFIIEKEKYNSYSEMIDRMEDLGEKLEVKETKTMEKKTVKVKNLAQAVLDAKEKGLKEFKVGEETYNVDECYKQLEEEEMCAECGDMNEESDVEESNAFVVAADAARDAGKKEFEFPKGSGKMHKVTIKKDIDIKEDDSDNDILSTIWNQCSDECTEEINPSDYSDEFEFGDNFLSCMVDMAISKNLINDEDRDDILDKLKMEYGDDVLEMFGREDEEMNESHKECNECGAMLNEEGMCSECGTPMNESKKTTLRLTESELVSLISKMVNEAVPGLEVTKKAQKGSGDESKSHMADVEKKLKDVSSFDGNDNPEFPKAIGKGDTVAQRTTDEENENIEDYRGGGLEDLNYDYEPSERFKDRLKKALEGDSTMGNSQDAANVIKTDTGKKIRIKAERKAEKVEDETTVSWGHRTKEPQDVKVVKESEKPTMGSVLEEEIKRMKKILGYNERTQ